MSGWTTPMASGEIQPVRALQELWEISMVQSKTTNMTHKPLDEKSTTGHYMIGCFLFPQCRLTLKYPAVP